MAKRQRGYPEYRPFDRDDASTFWAQPVADPPGVAIAYDPFDVTGFRLPDDLQPFPEQD